MPKPVLGVDDGEHFRIRKFGKQIINGQQGIPVAFQGLIERFWVNE